MKPQVIGLVGEMGAGKDTFCQHIQELFNRPVFCFKFSDPLSEVLKIFFDSVSREDQQWLAVVLRERFGKDILAKAIEKKILGVQEGLIILNGIRYREEFNMIKKIGGKIIYITADSKLRWQRLQKRGEKKDDDAPYEKFLDLEKAATEVLIPEIGKEADYKIENNGSLEEFHQNIGQLMGEFNED